VSFIHASPPHRGESLKNFETIEPPTIKEAWRKAKVRNKYFVRELETLPPAREHPNREK